MPRKRSLLVCLVVLTGCATLSQLRALHRVDFSLDSVSDVRLAGVDLTRIRSFGDLSISDVARLTTAIGNRDLPLSLDVQVVAENPIDNSADARLVQMDWIFFLEDRETVDGRVAEEFLLRRGEPTTVPVRVSLNLVEFYEGSARDMVELGLSLAGVGGSPKEISLEAYPVVQTVLGPITYPGPVRLSATLGGSAQP